jgi:hypothetical protein
MSAKSVSSKSVSSKSIAKSSVSHYCKVCHDSGKPESEYRSHSTRETRDPNSKVTCPMLLAIECRFCHKSGHTVKYCPALKEKKRDDARASKRVISKPKPVVVNEKVVNFYDCLLEEENDKPEEQEQEPEEFPEFSMNKVVSSSQLNYAAALVKPVVKEMPMVRTTSTMPMEKKSWVQMSMESDSEDEEDGSAW